MGIRTILIAGLITGTAGSAVAWHNHLTKSTPASDEQVAKAPTAIRLWFAEKPVEKFTSISLQKADSTKVTVGKTHRTDDSMSVAAHVSQPPAARKYTGT